MNEWVKTGLFAFVALLLGTWALVLELGGNGGTATVSEEGKPFFPDFKDPLAARSIEVIDYDEETASVKPFKVEFRDGKWVIPSRFNYPADAEKRLAETAAAVIDLRRGPLRSDRVQDHEALGVIDPLDESTSSLKGRGKRVILKDGEGKVLADLIIGKEVPGGRDMRFVRVPGRKRTYAAKITAEISAKFSDWIETDLLKLDSWDLTRLKIKDYRIDEERGVVEEAGTFLLVRDEDRAWKLPGLKEGEELDEDAVREMTDALDDLKIVDVFPKPSGLTAALTVEGERRISQVDELSLQSRGFYLYRGTLLSNEGELTAMTDEGVVYVLRFGEVVVGNRKEEDKEGGEDRYLMVTAHFDPELIPPPDLPKPKEGETEEEKKKREEETKRKKEEHQKKIEEGKKKAEELNRRFAGWYYVISGKVFRKIRLDRERLIKKEEPEKEGDGKEEGTQPEKGEEKPPEKSGGEKGKPEGHGEEEKGKEKQPDKSAGKKEKPEQGRGKEEKGQPVKGGEKQSEKGKPAGGKEKPEEAEPPRKGEGGPEKDRREEAPEPGRDGGEGAEPNRGAPAPAEKSPASGREDGGGKQPEDKPGK